MYYIDTKNKLMKFCEDHAKCPVLGVDTEFIRERSYYPKLCLIQFCDGSETFIVDPLAIKDLSPLKSIFLDKNCVKVFHSCSQDLEVLYHSIGVVPDPIFDTQLAAGLIGLAYQAALSTLIHSFYGVKLSKTDSFSEWSERPLSASQLKYAKEDVLYLPDMYEKMREELKNFGRYNWLDEEFEMLQNSAKGVKDPDKAYIHLKRSTHLNKKELCIAQKLCKRREQLAQQKDLPIRWIMTDDLLFEIVKKKPVDTDELFKIRGAKENISKNDAEKIIEHIASTDFNQELLPVDKYVAKKKQRATGIVDLMFVLLKIRAKQYKVAYQLVCSSKDLSHLAMGDTENSKLMHGWRYNFIGRELQDLLEGKIGITFRDNRIVVHKLR
ncbi:MAG: ribonuclease D [Enterococcus sp.]|nr:ribonuclease D [Enterococcus sp.]